MGLWVSLKNEVPATIFLYNYKNASPATIFFNLIKEGRAKKKTAAMRF